MHMEIKNNKMLLITQEIWFYKFGYHYSFNIQQ